MSKTILVSVGLFVGVAAGIALTFVGLQYRTARKSSRGDFTAVAAARCEGVAGEWMDDSWKPFTPEASCRQVVVDAERAGMTGAVPCTFGGFPAACANGIGEDAPFFLIYMQAHVVRIPNRTMENIGPHIRIF